jgi:hypothetical protein
MFFYPGKADKHMATERSEDIGSGASGETTRTQEDASAIIQASHNRAWYTVLNEDWLATLFGLLLVILLVVGLLHSIP